MTYYCQYCGAEVIPPDDPSELWTHRFNGSPFAGGAGVERHQAVPDDICPVTGRDSRACDSFDHVNCSLEARMTRAEERELWTP